MVSGVCLCEMCAMWRVCVVSKLCLCEVSALWTAVNLVCLRCVHCLVFVYCNCCVFGLGVCTVLYLCGVCLWCVHSEVCGCGQLCVSVSGVKNLKCVFVGVVCLCEVSTLWNVG